MYRKQKLTRIFLVLELCACAVALCVGSHSVQAIYALHKDLTVLQDEIHRLEHEVVELETDVMQWREDDFLKEKMAREQLQMARAGEIIYYIE